MMGCDSDADGCIVEHTRHVELRTVVSAFRQRAGTMREDPRQSVIEGNESEGAPFDWRFWKAADIREVACRGRRDSARAMPDRSSRLTRPRLRAPAAPCRRRGEHWFCMGAVTRCTVCVCACMRCHENASRVLTHMLRTII